MKPGKVRPIAVCVFRKDDHILVAERFDATKQQSFYRPPGGTIEFGEYSQETVVRELKEEIGADATPLSAPLRFRPAKTSGGRNVSKRSIASNIARIT